VSFSGLPRRGQRVRKWGLALTLAGSALLGATLPSVSVLAKDNTPALASVALSTLPVEAQATERLIRSGGPFPYAKDGVVFGNRERVLPAHKRGFYREYTVRSPGSRDRGARRIVCGGREPVQPEACYYTDDHYASFRRIVQ
jgi:ribonuclease T1